MSFKRFDNEDVVLSSELVTFPTWYSQRDGDTDTLYKEDIIDGPEQGPSVDYYINYYSSYSGSSATDTASAEPHYDADHSKPLFSLAFAERPDTDDGSVYFGPEKYEEVSELNKYKTYYTYNSETQEFVLYTDRDPETEEYIVVPGEIYYKKIKSGASPSEIIYGQFRSLVLGDEYSDFTFGSVRIGSTDEDSEIKRSADSFMAMTVDRSRFREKLDPATCEFHFKIGEKDDPSYEPTGSEPIPQVDDIIVLKPDTSANRRYLDAGRVFDLAQLTEVTGSSGAVTQSLVYPTDSKGETTSYGYFLPDIGVVLFNTSDGGSLFGSFEIDFNDYQNEGLDPRSFIQAFKDKMEVIKVRSQETVTSNFVFVRARNGEFNYSTNPSNIVGSAGNIRHDVMINQPQSFVTTVGLYNDSNELLAVAKLSRPLIKDFTKEALIRIKLDY